MSAFIQPDGSINPIFRSYLVESNEGQLLTRAETLSQRRRNNKFHCVSLLTVFWPSRGGGHSCADQLDLLSVCQDRLRTPVELQLR